jgi:hypothetical protein
LAAPVLPGWQHATASVRVLLLPGDRLLSAACHTCTMQVPWLHPLYHNCKGGSSATM